MHSEKSPGPDGLNHAYYQYFWDVVGDDVIHYCQEYISTGVLPVGVNQALVCLILKLKEPQTMADLRLISLCNVLVRIMSKVLSNRLKLSLKLSISDKLECVYRGQIAKL